MWELLAQRREVKSWQLGSVRAVWGDQALQHVEVSERRRTQKTDKPDGGGDKLPVINHASAAGPQM